ncbi:MAG: extracellular solute-binding protein, partial [Treponema sp.]|nr:extracellular solute-binding protein [Treponema sp.]
GTDGGRTKADDNAWTAWVKDKVLKDLNIEVTFIPVGRWSEETDIVNLMASGSAPDLCYTYNTGVLNGFRDQGGIMDLAPYIERLLPDMKKLLGADPALPGKDFINRNLQQDGKMYSIPSYRVALAIRNIFIRKDWLDKLGLPLPTNVDQFHNALIAFRDRDPGNVGRQKVVPLGTDAGARWRLADLVHHYLPTNISDRDRYVYNPNLGNRRLSYPGMKEGVRVMNQWYNEGLIFHDFPIWRVADDFVNLIKSGVVGAFSGNYDEPYRTDYKIIEELRVNVPGADYVPLDITQNKEIYDKVGLQIFVPAFSKNPEAALRYLNWLCIPENYQFLQRGQEGVNHRMVNNVPQILTRPANDPWFQNSLQNIDITMPMNGVEMGSDEMNARVLAFSYGGFASEVIVNAYQTSVRNARAQVVVPGAVTVQDGIYGQVLIDKADAVIAQAITARPADFDRVWDAGVADWMASGGQAVMDERAAIARTIWR